MRRQNQRDGNLRRTQLSVAGIEDERKGMR